MLLEQSRSINKMFDVRKPSSGSVDPTRSTFLLRIRVAPDSRRLESAGDVWIFLNVPSSGRVDGRLWQVTSFCWMSGGDDALDVRGFPSFGIPIKPRRRWICYEKEEKDYICIFGINEC